MSNVIELKNVSKQYKTQMAVDDVSFEIEQGSIVGLVGPNGAGKTTIMKMVGGLAIPTTGEISIFGETDENGLCHSRSRMCFMIETPYAKQDLTARQNVEKQRIQRGVPDKKRTDEVLKLAGLDNTGKKEVKKFSLGMKQRLGIAMSLLSRPEVMILDEPVNGLDPQGIVEIRNMLLKLNREEHITIVISSHLLSELSLLCTDYLFINKGQIIKKISAPDLEKECRQYLHLHTDNDEMAVAILSDKLGINKIDAGDRNSIRVCERMDEARLISKTLSDNGVIPVEIFVKEVTLEKYYMDLVGEEYVEYN